MTKQAIISLLWPKNIDIVLTYVGQHEPHTLISMRNLLGEQEKALLEATGSAVIFLDDILTPARKKSVQAAVEKLQDDFARWGRFDSPSALIENKARATTTFRANLDLLPALELISALDEIASEHAIKLLIVNEEWMLPSQTSCRWAKKYGIPSLHIAHNPFLLTPYTIHQHRSSDHVAVFDKSSQLALMDAGFPAEALHITGLPQFDRLEAERNNRQYWRDFISSKHHLDPTKPIVVYGTTWTAGLSKLDTPENPETVLLAFFKTIKILGDRIQHIIKDRPATGKESEHFVRRLANSLGVKNSDFAYVQEVLDEHGVPIEKPLPYLLGSDVVVANDSGLLIEAMCVFTPAINLLTDHCIPYGPAYMGDYGIVECEPEELPNQILSVLAAPHLTEHLKAGWQQLKGDVGSNATENIVALMHKLALQHPAPIPFQPDAPIRTKAPPPVWKTLLEVEDTDATGYHGGVRDGLVDLSPRPIRCALDIGCAAGGTGAYIKSKYPKAKVIGIEVNRSAAEYAKQKLDHVLVGRFEEVNLADAGLKPGSIDTVIVADVLEHMYDPWSVLTALRPWLTMDAQIIASIPNVRNLKLMEDLAAGYWRYEDSGLLDITHIRFFTLKEIRRFFHETGYHVRTLQYAIDPRLMALRDQLSKQPAPLDIRMGRMSLHGVEGAEIDELCSLQFYFIVGNNARIDDIETYRTIPPDLLLLERLAPTPQDGPLWEQHLATWPIRPAIHLFLLDTAGNMEAVTASISNLTRQLYSEIQITVVSPTLTPSGLDNAGRISWQPYQPETSPFITVNSELGGKSEQWTGIIYAGDILEPAALMRLMELGRRQPEFNCLYGDDTRLQQGIPSHFNLKPDFDPWLLQGHDYLSTGLTLFSASWLKATGGFSTDLRGREILDAALRLCSQKGDASFGHLAEPILHRPLGGNDGDLPFAIVNQSHREALLRYATQREENISIEEGWLAGTLRIKRQPTDWLKISILMLIEADTPPFPDSMETLLEKTAYPDLEILLLDTGASDPAAREFINALDALDSPQFRVFRLDNPINPIQAANLLAEQANGELLVFFRPGLAPIQATWLQDLSAIATESMVGAVSPRILDKKGRVFASGLFVGIDQGVADAYRGMAHLDAGVTGRAHLTQCFSSLPGHCLLTRREVFEAAGGLDAEQAETLANAFADYGLRLTGAGLGCLWTPFISLLNMAPDMETPAPPLPDVLFERHLNLLRRDPAYHPALAPKSPLFSWEKRPELISDRFPWRPLPRTLAFHADLGGCGYYRIIEPAKALSTAYQAEANSSCYIFGATEVARVAPDSLVMQRQITDEQQARLKQVRRLIKCPIAFELDDLMFDMPKHSPHHEETPKDIEARLRESIGLCDRLIVSTAPLAEALHSTHSNIIVLPNYLPTTRWEGLTPQIRQSEKPRVGWSGSVSHVGDLLIIEEVVRELAKEVDWIFMGLAPDALRPYIAEYHPGVPFEEYPEALAKLDLDLALAPLELCRFNECKTNLKLLEYGILAYPVIATDITPYRGDIPIQRVKNKRGHWVKAIREHINDLDTCRQIGTALQRHIRQHWMLEDHLDEYLAAWTRY